MTSEFHSRLRNLLTDDLAPFAAGLLLASFALLSTLVTLTGMTLDWTGLGACIGFSAGFLVIGLAIRIAGDNARMGNVALALAVLSGTTVCNVFSMNIALRLRMPLVDAKLVALDHMIGFDSARLVLNFASHPVLTQALGWVYVQANWLTVVIVLCQCLRPTPDWRPLIVYSLCLSVSVVATAFLPAIGNIPYSHLTYLENHGLPWGAGSYHLDAFRYFHDGTGQIVGNANLSGVGVFPSFHTVMGLIIATALRGTRFHLAGAAFGAATIVSTVPMGGHYVSDVIAGILVWAAAMALAGLPARAAKRRNPAAQPEPMPREPSLKPLAA